MDGVDSPYFRVVPAEPVTPADPEPGEIARGDSWSVLLDGDVPMLRYQSGEHGGGLRRIAITETELAALLAGTTTADAVLIAHHAS